MQIFNTQLMSGCLLILVSTWSYADDTSKQLQMLNSQLQVQLQRIQESQQTQMQTLNKQLQAQLADTQKKLQNQISALNKSTQQQIKALQTALEAKIQKVHEEVLTGGPVDSSNAAPATVTDGKTGNTDAKAKLPAGLQ